MTDELTWGTLAPGELRAVAALAARCVAADGGLPLVADEAFLARRFAGEGVRTLVAEAAGSLVAAAATRPQDQGVRATGLVDPDWRGRGLGSRLLDWQLGEGAAHATAGEGAAHATAGEGAARGTAGDGAGRPPVTVETEALTPAAERLFATRGLGCVFAEEVLRFDLDAGAPLSPVPEGVVLRSWDADLAPRFYAVYHAAFAERPGFPGWPLQTWVDWVAGDDDFRPQWSLLASDEAGDLGFIACADGWVVQVGVLPSARGRGIGSALVCAALDRMRADGAAVAYLDVNVDNPAARLYRRLGFVDVGRRARFA
ncbi:N-acetyltransferase [Luedemannella helvata]|uniref:N-acetyltransferase domain-containing protein n=1 Tax=Luedemannella helvata TaxID=349315 RepID=A0ABP4WK94_9ACTN